jgi:hypothetical protein
VQSSGRLGHLISHHPLLYNRLLYSSLCYITPFERYITYSGVLCDICYITPCYEQVLYGIPGVLYNITCMYNTCYINPITSRCYISKLRHSYITGIKSRYHIYLPWYVIKQHLFHNMTLYNTLLYNNMFYNIPDILYNTLYMMICSIS